MAAKRSFRCEEACIWLFSPIRFFAAGFYFVTAVFICPSLRASEFPELLSIRMKPGSQALPIESAFDSRGGLDIAPGLRNPVLSQPAIWSMPPKVSDQQDIDRIFVSNREGQTSLLSESPTSQRSDDEIDIDSPGPDMGDYPNSAYTLRKGRTQLEIGPASFRTQNANNSSAYATPFLLRYGLTNDVELRLLGTGLTTLISPNETTGFGVLTFDTKIHLWNDDIERLVPAVSFEASIQTQIGSPAFQAGIEPGLFINMDFPFTKKTNFECTFGFTGNQTSISLINFTARNQNQMGVLSQTSTSASINENIYAASFQWAVEQEITDRFSLFVHGYYARPVSQLNLNALVTGVGFFRKLSKRWMLFGSANAGLTSVPAPFLTQLGVATQF